MPRRIRRRLLPNITFNPLALFGHLAFLKTPFQDSIRYEHLPIHTEGTNLTQILKNHIIEFESIPDDKLNELLGQLKYFIEVLDINLEAIFDPDYDQLNLTKLQIDPLVEKDQLITLEEHHHNGDFHKISFDKFFHRLYHTTEKIYWHINIQTNFKLAMGATGWTLGMRLGLHYCLKSWRLWSLEGVTAMLGINFGMLSSQHLLAQYQRGRHANELLKIALLLIVSVTLADGAWQPITDYAGYVVRQTSEISEHLHIFVQIFLLKIGYLFTAYLFTVSQTLLDYAFSSRLQNINHHTQQRFPVPPEFTAKVWCCHYGFFVLPTIFESISDGFANFWPNLFIATIGATIIPVILGHADKTKALRSLNHIYKNLRASAQSVKILPDGRMETSQLPEIHREFNAYTWVDNVAIFAAHKSTYRITTGLHTLFAKAGNRISDSVANCFSYNR